MPRKKSCLVRHGSQISYHRASVTRKNKVERNIFQEEVDTVFSEHTLVALGSTPLLSHTTDERDPSVSGAMGQESNIIRVL